MRPPRGLTPEEATLWNRVAATVKPITKDPPLQGRGTTEGGGGAPAGNATLAKSRLPREPLPQPTAGPPPRAKLGADNRPLDRSTLDGTWERKLAKAQIAPDFTLDLHGHTLDAAHRRLDHGLALAIAQQARVVLVITGKPRQVDAADRGSRRGAIRAKLLDWLAAGPHASKIAAIRPAHQRHGGAGAVYVVLRRARA